MPYDVKDGYWSWDERYGVTAPYTSTIRPEEGETFIMVEDTFRNSFYRFACHELEMVKLFLTDPEERPNTPRVWLVGQVLEITEYMGDLTRND